MRAGFPSLILLTAALSAGSAYGQTGGVTILRGEGDQPRPGVPDTGVRRVPSTGPSTGGVPRPTIPLPPTSSQLPIGNGNGVVPPAPQSDMAQAIKSGTPLSPAESAALAAAFKAIDERRWTDARAAVA